MNDTTAREAHELWLEISESLSQILTKAMTHISILRHQRYHIDINGTHIKHKNLKNRFLTSRIRCNHSMMLLPNGASQINNGLTQKLGIFAPTLRLYKGHTDFLVTTLYITQECREIILFTSLYREAVETIVLNAIALPASVVIKLFDTLDMETHVVGIVWMNRIVHTCL